MKKHFFLIVILSYSINIMAQKIIDYKGKKINELDNNNNKTGVWKLFDEQKKILITSSFVDDNFVSDTNFYKDSILIASYNNKDKLKIFKDSEIIICNFFRKEDKSQTLIDLNGKEIDNDILKFYYLNVGEVMPMFYGGKSKLYEFISNNFNSKGNRGKLKIEFYVDTKGFTTQIKVVESTNEKLNDEAIRIISILPRWQPGFQGGEFVNVFYRLPITIN